MHPADLNGHGLKSFNKTVPVTTVNISEIPAILKTIYLCGRVEYTHLKNSWSSLYHFTAYNSSMPMSKWQSSSISWRRSATTGAFILVRRSPLDCPTGIYKAPRLHILISSCLESGHFCSFRGKIKWGIVIKRKF